MGAGAVVLLHVTVPIGNRTPRLFFTREDLRQTSVRYRVDALNAMLDAAGRSAGRFTSEQWIGNNREAFAGLDEFIQTEGFMR